MNNEERLLRIVEDARADRDVLDMFQRQAFGILAKVGITYNEAETFLENFGHRTKVTNLAAHEAEL